MSNKTDLQTLNAQYESLIEELRGKAVGGGSVETCTVKVRCVSGIIYAIDYVTVDDSGNVIYKCITPNSSNEQTLTCVCNTHVVTCTNSGGPTTLVNGAPDSRVLFSRPYNSIVNVDTAPGTIMIIQTNTSSGGSN